MISENDKREIAQVMEGANLVSETDLATIQNAPEESFRYLKLESFHPFTVNLCDIHQAINWISLGHPELARITLLKAIGSPIKK